MLLKLLLIVLFTSRMIHDDKTRRCFQCSMKIQSNRRYTGTFLFICKSIHQESLCATVMLVSIVYRLKLCQNLTIHLMNLQFVVMKQKRILEHFLKKYFHQHKIFLKIILETLGQKILNVNFEDRK